MSLAIETHKLSKRYPATGDGAGLRLPFRSERGPLAVDRVTLAVPEGEVFGLVGPNGAGKTTLVKMLTTLILPTSGRARVGGYPLLEDDNRSIKASIGLVTGNERSFFPRLTCRENLQFYAGLHNLPPRRATERIDELSELLDLNEFLDKRYERCSTGMKHRLALARSLVNAPSLLFLDEPTRSLDPVAAARFRQAVYALARRDDCTVFLVTHNLDEAVELCDRVGMMLEGRLRVVDAPGKLRPLLRPRQACSLKIREFGPELSRALERLEWVESVKVDPGGKMPGEVTSVTLQLQDHTSALPALTRIVGDMGGSLETLAFEDASWEASFAALDEDPSSPNGAAGPVVGTAEEIGKQEAPDPLPLREGTESDRADTPGVTGQDGIGHTLQKPLLFFRRDLKTQMRYRLSFLLQLLGILFSSASFYFVAQLLGASAAPLLDRYGGDYFSFVLIGIAFVGYQGVALYTFTNTIRSAQTAGTLEAMLVTPTRLPTILFSSSVWNFALTSLRVVVYLLAGVIVFGADLRGANVLAGTVVLGLTVLTLSSIGILSASFIMVFKRGSPINFLIGSLSSLLAGVYYPVDVLPGWLQQVARLFPLTYSLEAMRRAMLTGESLAGLARPVGVLCAFAALLLPLSLLAFRYAVRQAKRDGSLTHF